MAVLFQKRKKEPAEKTPVEAAQALQETIVCPACGREINMIAFIKCFHNSVHCFFIHGLQYHSMLF